MDLGHLLLNSVDADGMDGQWWKHSTDGNKEFHSTRISLAFGSRSTAMSDGEYASTLNMSELRDGL